MSYDVRVTLRQEGDRFVPAEGHTAMDRIFFNSSSTDQLCYPLVHLHGEGALADSESTLGRRRRCGHEDRAPTLHQYYAYRLRVRPGAFNPLLLTRKLTSQDVIDAAVKIQDERLRYIRDHRQDTLLRSESAQKLCEHIARESESEKVGKSVGHICILPVDFPGSEKFMHKQYHDAMAIVATYSKADYFITFAASGQWPEIKEAMLVGGYVGVVPLSHHRPDIVIRVFMLRWRTYVTHYTIRPLGKWNITHMLSSFKKRVFLTSV